ncbi:UNVERIFIED_CONTAM: hypothetical protein FKN15_018669 [Acipenser sinensis]
MNVFHSPCLSVIADPLEKEHRLVSVLQSLPSVNRNTFLFLLEHLRRCTPYCNPFKRIPQRERSTV